MQKDQSSETSQTSTERKLKENKLKLSNTSLSDISWTHCEFPRNVQSGKIISRLSFVLHLLKKEEVVFRNQKRKYFILKSFVEGRKVPKIICLYFKRRIKSGAKFICHWEKCKICKNMQHNLTYAKYAQNT